MSGVQLRSEKHLSVRARRPTARALRTRTPGIQIHRAVIARSRLKEHITVMVQEGLEYRDKWNCPCPTLCST